MTKPDLFSTETIFETVSVRFFLFYIFKNFILIKGKKKIR